MGIIRWGLDAARTTYADQTKEAFRAEGMNNDVLAVPGTRARTQGGTNRVITDGSVFNVGINQAALLIENGKVHDFVIADNESMTGQYIYDSDKEPSLLTGGMKEWGNVWKTVKERFTFGGQSPNTMDLVYINLKEITENPVGIGKLPFIDQYLGTRLMLGAHGYYTFRITNPVAFYENVLMDATRRYTKDDITPQLKAEMMPKIANAIARVAPECVNGYQDIYLHDEDIAKALNEALGADWLDNRGIQLVKVALTPQLSPEDTKRVMELENAKTLSNTTMAFGSMVNSHNNASQSAAANPNGAINGFFGMNMANGGNNNGNGFNMNEIFAAKMQQEAEERKAAQQAAAAQAAPAQPVQPSGADIWTCPNCQAENAGKFCANCGTPRPAKPAARFCSNCGNKLEPGAKFCPNCGTKAN